MKKTILLFALSLLSISVILSQDYVSHRQLYTTYEGQGEYNEKRIINFNGNKFKAELPNGNILQGTITLESDEIKEGKRTRAYQTDKGCVIAINEDNIFLNLFKTDKIAYTYYLGSYIESAEVEEREVDPQNKESILQTLDSLQLLKDENARRAKEIDQQITETNNKLLAIEVERNLKEGFPLYVNNDCNIYKERATYSEKIGSLKAGTWIMGFKKESNYYLVRHDTLNGYISFMDVATAELYEARLKAQNEKKQAVQLAAQRSYASAQKRKEHLTDKYGASVADKLINGRIWLGMTKAMLIESQGSPTERKKRVNVYGTSETFIYSRYFFFFTEDVLTSYSER